MMSHAYTHVYLYLNHANILTNNVSNCLHLLKKFNTKNDYFALQKSFGWMGVGEFYVHIHDLLLCGFD